MLGDYEITKQVLKKEEPIKVNPIKDNGTEVQVSSKKDVMD